MVVTEPLPVPVERDQEHLRAFEAREHADGVVAPEDGVAERRREACEDRRPACEHALLGREGREALGLQVTAQVGVAAARAQRKPGQPDALGPAFGAFDHVVELSIRDSDAHRPEERPRLASREGEVVQGQLGAASPPARRRGREGSGCARPASTTIEPSGTCLTSPVMASEASRSSAWASSSTSTNGVSMTRAPTRDAGPTRRPRGDPARRLRERRRRRRRVGGIRPAPIERREREGTLVPLCPLREQRGLAVSGGRDKREDRLRARSPQPVHERCTGHLAGHAAPCRPPAVAGSGRCTADAPFHRLCPTRALLVDGVVPGTITDLG